MIALCRPLLALALIALAAPALAQEAKFSHPTVARDAELYERVLKVLANPPPPGVAIDAKAAQEARVAGLKQLAEGEAADAVKSLAKTAAFAPADVEALIALARAHLAVEVDGERPSLKAEHESRASAAAYLAFQRAKARPQIAEALAVLSEALVRRSMHRPAMEALRQSLLVVNDPERRKTYEELKAEHGFRVTDYKVDSNAAEPRLCIQFSEPLVAGADLAKFVSVDGRDPQGASTESEQICIDGLAHGKRYTLTIRAGVPAASGDLLPKAATLAVYVRDRARQVRFAGRAYVLPNRGQQGIPVVSVNTERVAIEIFRIGDRGLAAALQSGDFQRQIGTEELAAIRERKGQRIWKGQLEVKSRLNEDVTTAVPVSEVLPGLAPGVYVMSAATVGTRADRDDAVATQWFIVSDLGLSAMSGDDGIHAFVRSLASAGPWSGVNVRLVARNNDVLATAKTDGRGYVRFDVGLRRGEGGLAPAILVAETGEGDYAFLDLSTAAFDLSDRGVSGRDAPGPIDGFLYAERGIYRPGETVYMTGLVRDRAAKASAVPATLIVVRPDGVEWRRYPALDQGLGGRAQELPLPQTAMTGTWRARLHTDPRAPAIAQTSFMVEDFVPERIDLKLEAIDKALKPGAPGSLKVIGRFLYGPPAAGLTVEGDIVVKASTEDLPGLAGFRFGLSGDRISPIRRALDGLPETGADGVATASIMLPPVPRTARALEADLIIRLREGGGRAIERKITLPVASAEKRTGIRPLFKGAGIGEDETASFEAILIGTDNRPVAQKAFKWELVRLNQTWQWYNRDGSWAYESVTTTRRISAGTATTPDGGLARIDAKLDYGRYRLEVAPEGGGGAVASVVFNVGWYAGEGADSPEALEIALDKSAYKAGDTARVRIASKSGGKVQIAVVSGTLHTIKLADIKAGGGEVTLDVAEDWLPGAYVTATLYRPMDEAARRMPSRAIGVKWLAVDTAPRMLKVSIEAPEKVKPRTKVAVPVRLEGLGAGEEARITLAAVDAGVLGVTRYEPPRPTDWFYGRRKLGAEMRDLYGRLIDGMRAERGRLRTGGDGGPGGGANANPPVEKPLALYSGIVKTGPDGRAVVELELPDFNGTVRLMVVAWSATKVGNAAKDMIVRDALALTATAPRFLTLGDQARLSLKLHNVEAPSGTFRVVIEQEATGGKRTNVGSAEVTLAADQRKVERLTLTPKGIGPAVYEVQITGPGGVDVRRKLTYDVKPPAGDIRRMTLATLKAKGGRLTLSRDLFADLIPASAKATLNVGPGAAVDMAGLLMSLDRYPYGCAEQTTSRALPLLYVNEMAQRIGMGADRELRKRIEDAIERVSEMQDSSGAFGIWGPVDSGDMWLSSYVVDFLTRAKEAGFAVRPVGLTMALDRLQNFVSNAADFKSGGEAHAYALYVLARNGRAPVGELRYYVDTRLDRFATPLAQAQLGAAMAMLGDRERSERAFRAAMARLDGKSPAEVSRADYGSRLRDGAALVALVAEAKTMKSEAPRLMGIVSKAYALRQHTSTQEQAWLLLAARALADEAKAMTLDVAGTMHQGPLARRLLAGDLDLAPLGVTNQGDTEVQAAIAVVGSALTPEPPTSKGFTIERTYYTLEGKQVDLASAKGGTATLAQNERLVVVLKVEAKQAGGRVLLVDRLPAGLEIENARLVDGGDLKGLAWLKRTVEPEHRDFRDDRFVAAFNLFPRRGDSGGDNGQDKAKAGSSAIVAYVVRAVTPGSFVHPAATVEDMYQPERYARTASGRLQITARE